MSVSLMVCVFAHRQWTLPDPELKQIVDHFPMTVGKYDSAFPQS